MKIVMGIILAAALALSAGAWLYGLQQERAEAARELAEFDRALGRLESGVAHEPKILLRHTLADTAAAIDEYSKKGPARWKEGRVVLARKAIQDLEWALTDWHDYRVREDEDFFSSFAELGAAELKRRCSGGKLYIESTDLPGAYLRAFRRDLAVARGEKSYLPFEPFVLAAAKKACGEAYVKEKADRAAAQAMQEKKDAAARAEQERRDAAARAAAQAADEKRAAAHLSVFALHVEVRASPYAPVQVSADGGTTYTVFVGEDRPAHLDAQSSIRLSAARPATIRIAVNGKLWSADWLPAGSLGIGVPSTIIQLADVTARR